MSIPSVVLEVIGEGKTDVGEIDRATKAEPPTLGVLPILIYKLCNSPAALRVVRRRVAFLEHGKLARKVRFAKVQASNNKASGVVFVVDTEGTAPHRKLAELTAGRDEKLPDYPTAVGVAHTCIEAWLLADAGAIARAMKLPAEPEVPCAPEQLPAPQKDRNHNPKTVLAECAGAGASLSSSEASRIARELNDLPLVEARCPLSFAPFATEVRTRLAVLFDAS